MADDEEQEVIPARGADWEVVSLTASTFAAAPDTRGFELNDEGGSREESARALFMSDHFVFPPSEHENLPIEQPGCSETDDISVADNLISSEEDEEAETHDKLDDSSKEIEVNESIFSAHGLDVSESKEGKDSQGLYTVPCPESTNIANPANVSAQALNSADKNMKASEGKDYEGPAHPCLAWWKKHASSLYRHAKEANTFWSIFVAAALTGLVILGKRWR